MKYRIIIITTICLISLSTSAQQLTHYTQYLFNQFGNNPAFSNNSNCMELVAGRRSQWVGMPDAPLMQFFGVYKTFAHTGFKNYWHSAGFYVEQDKQNILKYEKIHLNYAYHYQIGGKYTISGGLFIGIHHQTMSTNGMDVNDPAIIPNISIWTYPDITAGFRFNSKTFFSDFVLRGVGKNEFRSDWKMVGSPSSQLPHLFTTFGKAIRSKAFYYTYIPSMQLKWSFTQLPTIDFQFMWLVMNKFGIGLNYRAHESVSGMIFVKLYPGVKVGFAYDMIINGLRPAATHSTEFMMKVSNCGSGTLFGEGRKFCPAYSL